VHRQALAFGVEVVPDLGEVTVIVEALDASDQIQPAECGGVSGFQA
jgi:hypothetical protein